jgi:hypothetical protein
MKTLFSAHPSDSARVIYLVLVIGAALCIGALFIGYLRQQHALDKQVDRTEFLAEQSHRVLCSLKADTRNRIEQAQAFLRQNPNGIDGITPLLIRARIQDDRARLASYADVKCAQS